MAGRSGIGVLVTGFSRVGALKKHAPLVFSLKAIYLFILHVDRCERFEMIIDINKT